jgi:DNA repair protein RadC
MMPAAPVYSLKIKTYSIRCSEPPPPSRGRRIVNPADAAPFLCAVLGEADAGREHFAVLFLDGKHVPMACRILFSGGASETAVYPREIARAALLMGACAVVIAHNHPSGDLTPSPEDLALTRRIETGLALIDIRVLDHLICSGEMSRALRISGGWGGVMQ